MTDDEHGGRDAYTRDDARARGRQPSCECSIAGGAQNRDTLASQRSVFGRRRSFALARVHRLEPTGKLNAGVLDSLDVDDHQPCSARIAERIVMLVGDAEIAAENVQPMAREMRPGALCDANAVEPFRLDWQSFVNPTGRPQSAFVEVRMGNGYASGEIVEALADRLRQRSERDRVPEEFFPHHGSLSKELREPLEARLKDGQLPTTAVATTTLELGIDLGSVKSVAQVGAPRSLAGLRQRLGRSGRRGEPAILRVYLREKHLAADSDPLDRLRLETARAVACVRLLQRNWVEPAAEDASLATVALHQTLSLIASGGGIRPAAAHRALFASDSYLEMKPADYADLLRGAAREGVDLLEQPQGDLLMLGEAGERLVQGRDFYAVFSTNHEWRLVSGGRTLGTLPLTNVLGVGSLVGFAGRRWRVEAVDDRAKVLEVVPHRSGKLPRFDRPSNEPLHDVVSATIRQVLSDDDDPAYLDAASREFLRQGRRMFVDVGLGSGNLVRAGNDTHLFTWHGTAVNGLLAILPMSAGLEVEVHDVGVTAVGTTPAELRSVMSALDGCPPLEELAGHVIGLRSAKLDDFIDESLLRRMWCHRSCHHRDAVTAIVTAFDH